MAAAAANKFRVWIFTGAFAAITATGAWYGAGLKTQQEYKQVFKGTTKSTGKISTNAIAGTH